MGKPRRLGSHFGAPFLTRLVAAVVLVGVFAAARADSFVRTPGITADLQGKIAVDIMKRGDFKQGDSQYSPLYPGGMEPSQILMFGLHGDRGLPMATLDGSSPGDVITIGAPPKFWRITYFHAATKMVWSNFFPCWLQWCNRGYGWGGFDGFSGPNPYEPYGKQMHWTLDWQMFYWPYGGTDGNGYSAGGSQAARIEATNGVTFVECMSTTPANGAARVWTCPDDPSIKVTESTGWPGAGVTSQFSISFNLQESWVFEREHDADTNTPADRSGRYFRTQVNNQQGVATELYVRPHFPSSSGMKGVGSQGRIALVRKYDRLAKPDARSGTISSAIRLVWRDTNKQTADCRDTIALMSGSSAVCSGYGTSGCPDGQECNMPGRANGCWVSQCEARDGSRYGCYDERCELYRGDPDGSSYDADWKLGSIVYPQFVSNLADNTGRRKHLRQDFFYEGKGTGGVPQFSKALRLVRDNVGIPPESNVAAGAGAPPPDKDMPDTSMAFSSGRVPTYSLRPYGHSYSFGYDTMWNDLRALKSVTYEVLGDQKTVDLRFYNYGQLFAIKGNAGNWSFGYNPNGFDAWYYIVDPVGLQTTYKVQALDNLNIAYLNNGGGGTSSCLPDNGCHYTFGVYETDNPDGSKRTVEYDATSLNPWKIHESHGTTTTMLYDSLGRVTQALDDCGNGVANVLYDPDLPKSAAHVVYKNALGQKLGNATNDIVEQKVFFKPGDNVPGAVAEPKTVTKQIAAEGVTTVAQTNYTPSPPDNGAPTGGKLSMAVATGGNTWPEGYTGVARFGDVYERYRTGTTRWRYQAAPTPACPEADQPGGDSCDTDSVNDAQVEDTIPFWPDGAAPIWLSGTPAWPDASCSDPSCTAYQVDADDDARMRRAVAGVLGIAESGPTTTTDWTRSSVTSGTGTTLGAVDVTGLDDEAYLESQDWSGMPTAYDLTQTTSSPASAPSGTTYDYVAPPTKKAVRLTREFARRQNLDGNMVNLGEYATVVRKTIGGNFAGGSFERYLQDSTGSYDLALGSIAHGSLNATTMAPLDAPGQASWENTYDPRWRPEYTIGCLFVDTGPDGTCHRDLFPGADLTNWRMKSSAGGETQNSDYQDSQCKPLFNTCDGPGYNTGWTLGGTISGGGGGDYGSYDPGSSDYGGYGSY